MSSAQTEEHPLLEKEFWYFRCLDDWKRAWARATHLEELNGLLFSGLSLPNWQPGEYENQICFYLSLADGHYDHEPIVRPGERNWATPVETSLGQVSSSSDLRKMVARKAFLVLCTNLFKTEQRGRWTVFVLQEPTMWRKFLWFFRPAEKNSCLVNISPTDADHSMKIACDFALTLAIGGWERSSQFTSKAPFYASLRPQFLEILHGLKKLHHLTHRAQFPMDVYTTARLWELAGEGEPYSPDALSRAIGRESQAAEVLLLLQQQSRAAKLSRQKRRRDARR